MRHGLDMANDTTAVTIMSDSRNLRTLPFRSTEDPLYTGKAWEEWLEENNNLSGQAEELQVKVRTMNEDLEAAKRLIEILLTKQKAESKGFFFRCIIIWRTKTIGKTTAYHNLNHMRIRYRPIRVERSLNFDWDKQQNFNEAVWQYRSGGK